MRLIIVEDEDLEHEGLGQMIKGFDLDIEVCGNAWNGQEALDMAESLRPDIVITDVRMPVMDGISFVAKLRVMLPGCIVLFISGFEDFNTVRDALSLGASAWLVKPVNREELLQVLNRVCDLAKSSKTKREVEDRIEKRLEELLPLERQEFMQSILLGRERLDNETAVGRAKSLKLQLYPGRYAVMVAETQEPHNHYSSRLDDKMDALAGNLGMVDMISSVMMPDFRLAFVLAFPMIADDAMVLGRLEDAAEKLRLQASAACGTCVGVGVSLISNSLETLANLYGQACCALDEKVRFGLGRVILFCDNPPERIVTCERISGMQMLKAVEAGSISQFMQLSNAFLQWMESCSDMQTTLAACLDIVSQLSVGAQSLPVLKDWLVAEQPIYEKLMGGRTIPDLHVFMKQSLDSLIVAMGACNAGRNEQIIRHVRKIVGQDIGGDLSAEAIAARVYLTASHLRRVFKNSMGITLQDYVLRSRMERAKELLKEPGRRVCDTAAAVGYENTSYFCIVFRQFFGVSPSEFRARVDYPG